jgi:translation initiation factor IF-3
LPKSNKQITADPVRLLDEKKTMLGIVPLSVALDKASMSGLDLVEISPKVDPPVCQLMDFGRFKYESKRTKQKAKKKQKATGLKEVRFRPAIGEHDLNIKVNQIKSFIAKGDKVRVVLRFKGREMSHYELGTAVIDKVIAKSSDVAVAEAPPAKESSRTLMVTLVAKTDHA